MPNRWLVKTSPARLPHEVLLARRPVIHRGVRSPPSAQRLAKMRRGDEVFLEYTGYRPAVFGTTRVRRGPFPDPEGAVAGDLAVLLAPIVPFEAPVPLALLRKQAELSDWELLTFPRLSVVAVPSRAWRVVLRLAGRGP